MGVPGRAAPQLALSAGLGSGAEQEPARCLHLCCMPVPHVWWAFALLSPTQSIGMCVCEVSRTSVAGCLLPAACHMEIQGLECAGRDALLLTNQGFGRSDSGVVGVCLLLSEAAHSCPKKCAG